MAASVVLRIGRDTSHRAAVLRTAGYEVEECASDAVAISWFQAGGRADVVCITEEMLVPSEAPLATVMCFSRAPVVLFRTSNQYYFQRSWDLEVPALAPPEEWLVGIEELLSHTRANIGCSEALDSKAHRLREESARVQEWSRRLSEETRREETRDLRGVPGLGE